MATALRTGFGDIAMTAKITPSTIPSAMAQKVIHTAPTRPCRIAGAVKNWPTTAQAICPSAKALARNPKATRISAAASQRP